MDHLQTGKLWDENAEAWTAMARAGYDVYRDCLNTPAFLAMLPEIGGMAGLDIGCGEGHNTRLLARRGAAMTGLDIAGRFLQNALLFACTCERIEINTRCATFHGGNMLISSLSRALPYDERTIGRT